MNSESIDYYEHPLFHPYELHIDTPLIDHLKKVLDGWLWNGATGGVIHGEARCGKTTALKSLSERLQTRGGKSIPTVYFTVPDRDRDTIKALYRALTVSANLPIRNQLDVESMFNNLAIYYMEMCRCKDAKHLVLLVDEAQRLSLKQYNVFADLHDFFREHFRTLLTVVFVVNSDEAEPIFERAATARYRHIYGRFFKKTAEFKGIQNEREVSDCLRQYDSLRFPASTGPTYTEFFLPRFAKKGWRYSTLSPVIWQTFRIYQKQFRLDSWGMDSFICTANMLLCDFLPIDGPEQCDVQMVSAAIEESGLVPSLVRATK